MSNSAIGPVLSATLVTDQFEQTVTAWTEFLHQSIHSQGEISAQLAHSWSAPMLAKKRYVWLQNSLNEPWLRIIEHESAKAIDPFSHKGWFSLEIAVDDVDTLYSQLIDSPFKIIGKPADLDVSPDIRAMQVIGPAGEVLYLTQIKAPVKGFELPTTRCFVDKLFIPVLLGSSRSGSLETYEQFPETKGICFDTKITVINRARGFAIDQRHPVAAIQLNGKNLIEIDQLENLKIKPDLGGMMTPGISIISLAINSVENIPDGHPVYTIEEDENPNKGCSASLLKGDNGELIELIVNTSST